MNSDNNTSLSELEELMWPSDAPKPPPLPTIPSDWFPDFPNPTPDPFPLDGSY
jgi:hypothetical protein